jgi:hypothetical protein
VKSPGGLRICSVIKQGHRSAQARRLVSCVLVHALHTRRPRQTQIGACRSCARRGGHVARQQASRCMASGQIPPQRSRNPYRGGLYKEGVMATPEEIKAAALEKDLAQQRQSELIKAAQQGACAEAPASVCIKFFLNGFNCQFTHRHAEPTELAKKVPGIINFLERIGATPTPARISTEAPAAEAAAEPKQPAAEAAAAPECPTCHVPGVYLAGENERGPWCGYKCRVCDEFIKGTFRRSKSYKSDRTMAAAQE